MDQKQELSENAVDIPIETKQIHLFLDRRVLGPKMVCYDLRKWIEPGVLKAQEYEGFTPTKKGITLPQETWEKVIIELQKVFASAS